VLNKPYQLDLVTRQCESNPDQVWMRLPKDVVVRPLKDKVYREPVEGELVTIFWMTANGPQQSSHHIGRKILLGEQKQFLAYEYKGSTDNGTCGGIYIANNDGAVVGFHAIGNISGNVRPKFFPATKKWDEEFQTFCSSPKVYNVSEDNSSWLKSFDAQIQFESYFEALSTIPEEENNTNSTSTSSLKA
jgi:hypothetical protein